MTDGAHEILVPADHDHSAGHPGAISVLALCAILALALGVRMYGLGAENYWLDEVHTLVASSASARQIEHNTILGRIPSMTKLTSEGGWSGVWSAMNQDVHPPLYFCVLNIWRSVFGSTEAAVRALSVLCSVAALIPVVLIGRAYDRLEPGLWAAGLLAVSLADIQLAQQARHYCMALLWLNLSAWLFVNLQRSATATRRMPPIGWSAGYAVCVLAALLTHYSAILVVLAHCVFAAVCLRGAVLKAWVTGLAGAGALFVVLCGPILRTQLAARHGYDWIVEDTGAPAVNAVIRFANLPPRLLLRLEADTLSILLAVTGGVALVGLAGLLCQRRSGFTWFVLLWYSVPATGLLVIDGLWGSGALGHLRYVIFCAPGLFLMVALAADRLPRAIGRVVLAAMILSACVMLSYPTRANPEANMLTERIEQLADDQTLLVINGIDAPQWFGEGLLLILAHYGQRLNCPVVLLDAVPGPMLQQALSAYPQIILINGRYVAPEWAPPDHRLLGASERLYRGFGRIYLYLSGRKPLSSN